MQSKLKTFRMALVLMMSLIVGTISAQTVNGNVVDETGEPVIGATVLEKGTKNAVITDFDGNFSIKLQGGKVITISYIGMQPQDVNVSGKTSVNVILKEDANTLQDVVVVGYGTMKKTDLTGSVSSVNTEQLNAKGAPSVLANLQGSNPGVNITQTSGRGGDYNIEIRGRSSISSKTTPLFVVDGVMCNDIDWLNPQDIERIDVLKDASSTAIYGSRATAGVVMVTTKSGTTVNNKVSKPTISYDGYYGWSKTARMPEFMTGEQFYNYRFMKFLTYAGNGSTATSDVSSHPVYQIGGAVLEQCLLREDVGSGNYVMKEMLANGSTTDWPDLVTQNGSQQNHFLAVSGGSDAINYHFGVGYNGQEGVYKGDKSNRINFKGSVDAKINKVITAGFSFNAARIKNEYANDVAIQSAFRMNPYMKPYDANGNLNAKPGNYQALGTCSSYQFSDEPNPLLKMMSTNKERETWRLLGNVYLKFDIIKGLDFKTTFSPNYNYYRQGYFEGYKDENGNFYDSGLEQNSANLTNNRSFSWTWDNIINYNTTIAEDHNLGVMLLFSQEAGNTENTYIEGNEVMELTDWWNMGTAQRSDGTTGLSDASKTNYNESSMTSYAARLNYGYKGRYLLTATIRRDGSSKFTKDNRWGTFPSAAAAWRISEEPFMQKYEWLSNLKLRLAYGVTGNNTGIGSYDTQQTLSSPISYPFGSSYNTGYSASKIVNQDLKWETSTEYNAGIDFGFFGGRINGSVDVYQKTSKDLLFEVQLPLVSGGGKMVTNIGSVRNTGVEVALTTVNIDNKDWRWETTFTFAANKNKVREINGTGDRVLGSGTTDNLFVGYSANNVYAYEWGGIVTDRDMTVPDNEAAKNAGLTPGSTMKEYDYYYKVYGLTEGQPWIVDQNGDGKIDPEDRTIKSMDPKWTGSFTSNLSWKNWDFSFSLYAKVGYKIYSSFLTSNIGDLSDRGRQKLNMDWYIPAGTLIDCDGVNADGTYINPKYQETTHYGDYPFPNNGGTSGGVGRQSGEWNQAKGVQDASFLKVKNITLGYTFDKNFLNKFGCKHLRLYATVTNPFVFTSFKGFDPEWASAGVKQDGPSTVNYQIGASIKF
ncbi:MAG: TonB-dependent receptor [Prevotella sp.]|nr:TonB-dependent receptor [Prevotella sp.]